MDQEKLHRKISTLLDKQRLAVLSTSGDGSPYASLVAFCGSADLGQLFFATSRTTRKYANLTSRPRVALLVDSRSNREEDFHRADAVTVLGKCRELQGEEHEQAALYYSEKHPYLKDFISAPSTAFLAVKVARYLYVSRFQEVFEYRVADDSDPSPQPGI